MQTVLGYVLAFGGLGMLLVAVVPALASNLSYPAGRLMLTNMLRTDPNRAEILCHSMPKSFFEAIGAAMKSGAMVGVQDPAVIASATRPAYDAAGKAIGMHWTQVLGKVKLGGLAVGGGLMLVVSNHAMPIWLVVIVALAGAGLGVLLILRKLGVERSLVLARADLLPEVERTLAEGRYVRRPPP